MPPKPTTNPTAPAPSCSLQGGAGDSFTVDYFIEKFEKIPDELWCVDDYESGPKRCALGHCGDIGDVSINDETKSLVAMFQDCIRTQVHAVNDGATMRYNQPTPKSRILAALRDIKAKQEAQQ